MGSVYYHGTNEQKANKILSDGFQSGTYFTWDLHSALVMGGMWVFGIYIKDKGIEDYWEWRNSEVILADRILYLRKFSVECIHDSENELEKINIINHKEEYGDQIIHCNHCKGRGQTSPANLYGGWQTSKLIVCEKCGGFGCTQLNGKYINDTNE
jgi:hypothetical protein